MMRVMLSKQALESLQRLSASDRERVADAIDKLQAGSGRGVSVGDRLVSPTTSRSYFYYRVSSKLRIVYAIDPARSAIYVVAIAPLTAKVFVASSVEGLEIARAIQENLEHDAETTVWNQGIFAPGAQVLQILRTVLESADFGIFVFSPDDITKFPEEEFRTVRDNVVLELGLFVGRLGLERNFIVTPRTGPRLRMPTDLLGIVTTQYDPGRLEDNPLAAVGPACAVIRRKLRQLGPAARSRTGLEEDERGTRSEDSSDETVRSRSMPHLDLEPKSTVAELRRVLERTRQRACERVKRIHDGVTPADFRVHIVLPDYSEYGKLGTQQLFLPKELIVGDHAIDEELRLWSGQGVVGRAFLRQVPEKVRITVGENGVATWPGGYEQTEPYKRSIPADLRWLVAIPLRVPRRNQELETMGVLGIQGLKFELTDAQIDVVIGFLLPDVMVVAALMSTLSLRVGVPEASAELPPDEIVLSEVTFDHLTDSEKLVLLDAGFDQLQVLIDSRDPEARRRAEVELAESYLKKPS